MKKLSSLVVLVLVGACVAYVGCSSSDGNGSGGAGGSQGGAGGTATVTGAAGHTANGGGTSAAGGIGGQASGAGGTSTIGSGGTSAVGSGGALGDNGGAAGHGPASGGTNGGTAGAAGHSPAAGSGGRGTGGQGGPAGQAGQGTGGAAGNGAGGTAGGGSPAGTGGGAGQAGAAGADGGGAAGARGASSTPDVLILLDVSGSMSDLLDGTHCTDSTCADGSKWSLVKTALAAALPPYDGNINWGLKLFATPAPSNACSVSSSVEIAPALANATAIAAWHDRVVPTTSTPTTAAETAAASYLASLADASPKFILLITDGIPTCGTGTCAPDASGQVVNQCDDAKAIAAVKSVHDTRGIPTIVVGIGTDLGTGAATLSQMANNGGFPRNASPQYYPVSSASDLIAAIAQTASIVTTGP